jgi:hypothetical protein
LVLRTSSQRQFMGFPLACQNMSLRDLHLQVEATIFKREIVSLVLRTSSQRQFMGFLLACRNMSLRDLHLQVEAVSYKRLQIAYPRVPFTGGFARLRTRFRSQSFTGRSAVTIKYAIRPILSLRAQFSGRSSLILNNSDCEPCINIKDYN